MEDEFGLDNEEDYFLREAEEMIKASGTYIQLDIQGQTRAGHLVLRQDEYQVVAPIMEKTETYFTMVHDWRQSKSVLSYIKALEYDEFTPFPSDLPPYEPIYESKHIVSDEIRKVNTKVCSLLEHDPDETKGDPYVKYIPRRDTEDKFVGFQDENTYDGNGLHWRFNPYSIKGMQMTTSTKETHNFITGTYLFKDKEFNFRYYKEESPYYIIHADEWFPHIKTTSSIMEAFSLAKTSEYWVYKAHTRKQQLVPTTYKKVSISKSMEMPPYCISRPIDRCQDTEDWGYMAYGSSKIYIPERAYVEEITNKSLWLRQVNYQKPQEYLLADKLWRRLNNRLFEEYIALGEIKEKGDYYVTANAYEIGAIRVIDKGNRAYYYDDKYIYRQGMYPSKVSYLYAHEREYKYTERAISVLVPMHGAYVNRYGQSIVFSGMPVSKVIYMHKTITANDLQRKFVAHYGGREKLTDKRMIGMMTHEIDEYYAYEELIMDFG